MYKTAYEAHTQKTPNQNKKKTKIQRQKTSIDISPKKTYRWPRDT